MFDTSLLLFLGCTDVPFIPNTCANGDCFLMDNGNNVGVARDGSYTGQNVRKDFDQSKKASFISKRHIFSTENAV